MKNKRGPCYKLQLWRSRRIGGYFEELVVANFYPAEVSGFGTAINQPNHNVGKKTIDLLKSA